MAEPASKLTKRLWDEAARTKNNYRRDLLREAAVALEQAEKALARIAAGRDEWYDGIEACSKTLRRRALQTIAREALAALKGENV